MFRPLAVVVAVLVAGAALPAAATEDPPWSVPEPDLSAALDCTDFTHPETEPLLLVHGTVTRGHEQYDWNYALELGDRGFDWCVVTYPDRGLDDLQVSAEYVAWAVLDIHERTGSAVDVVGHSQGGLMPRWALKWWPSVRAVVDDFVGVAPPNHGTIVIDPFVQTFGVTTGVPAAVWQMRPGSDFVTALNDGDESPGDVDYTQIYSAFDQAVQPAAVPSPLHPDVPAPTAALDLGDSNPHVANILIQDLCPGRVVDHLTIGTTDRLSFELVIDALTNPGPADPGRLDIPATCLLPDQILDPAQQIPTFFALGPEFFATVPPPFHLRTDEPPLMPYAVTSARLDVPVGDVEPDAARPASEQAPAELAATGSGSTVTASALLSAASILAAGRRRRARAG